MTSKLNEMEMAFENFDFLGGKGARILRILAEYLEPSHRFRRLNILDTVVFFGSARAKSLEEAEVMIKEAEKKQAENKAPSVEIEAGLKEARRMLKLAPYYEDARTLSRMIVEWSHAINQDIFICTGGGPGMMEAANRGAYEADPKRSVGLNISLPFEQSVNPYITRDLSFAFHYFFMRKFWFAYMAKALVIFPGGFGTFDELFEVLTLAQTHKLEKRIPILIYGREFWESVVNIASLSDWGVIEEMDMDLFHFADTPEEAFAYLKEAVPDSIKRQKKVFYEKYPEEKIWDENHS